MENLDSQPNSDNMPEANTPSQQTTYTSNIKVKKKSPIWILMLFALILIAGGIFFLAKKASKKQLPSPTPETLGYEATEQPVATETSTPKPVDRQKIKIQILNGTGIAKEASYLQGKLRNLGYSTIDTGNADKDTYETTEVTFSDLEDEIIDEITKELEKTYKNVKVKTGSTGSYDIKIITGLQKGATPKPTATLSSSPTGSPKSTSSPTPSPSISPSPT